MITRTGGLGCDSGEARAHFERMMQACRRDQQPFPGAWRVRMGLIAVGAALLVLAAAQILLLPGLPS